MILLKSFDYLLIQYVIDTTNWQYEIEIDTHWEQKTQEEDKQNIGYTRHKKKTNKTLGTQDTRRRQTKHWVHKTQEEDKQNQKYN
jgi:hypothetical protein